MRWHAVLKYVAASIGVLAVTLLAGWWQVDGPGAPKPTNGRPLPLNRMAFSLTDHEGRSVRPESLMGRASLIFFGFTWCPDVCPTTLSDISGWLDGLGEDGDRLNVIMITVDPARDTVQTLAEYVGHFHPAIRGWTGTKAEVAQAVEGFRAKFERIPIEGGGYTMNHTAGVFLFDADGKLASVIDPHEPRQFALPKIRRVLDRPAMETG